MFDMHPSDLRQDPGDIEIDADAGAIHDMTTGERFQAAPFPEFVQQIMAKGGLSRYAEERLAAGVS